MDKRNGGVCDANTAGVSVERISGRPTEQSSLLGHGHHPSSLRRTGFKITARALAMRSFAVTSS